MEKKVKRKTRKVCKTLSVSSALSLVFCFVAFFFMVIAVKSLCRSFSDTYDCKTKLKFNPGSRVYIRDRGGNVFSGFRVVEDNKEHEGETYVLINYDTEIHVTHGSSKTFLGHASFMLYAFTAYRLDLLLENAPKTEDEYTDANLEKKVNYMNSILRNIDADQLLYNESNIFNPFTKESTILEYVSESAVKSKTIAVPRKYIRRPDSLNACLLGVDPLHLFETGEDQAGMKSKLFRNWKLGIKPEQNKSFFENIPIINFFTAESNESNQINYFVYKLFVPISRLSCHLEQVNFNKNESLCKVTEALDNAIFLPSIFKEDKVRELERELAKLNRQTAEKSNEIKKVEEELETLKKQDLKSDFFDKLKDIFYVFANFLWKYFRDVGLFLISMLVHYVILFIDIVEISLTSFLRVSSGVSTAKGSLGMIFSNIFDGVGKVASNPATAVALGLATSGVGPLLMQGLGILSGASGAAIASRTKSHIYAEEFKAQGFSNLAATVAKNPKGVYYFTKTFASQFVKFGLFAPVTLFFKMHNVICEQMDKFVHGKEDDDDDDDVDEDESGRLAAEKLMLETNEGIGRSLRNFEESNSKSMKESWEDITAPVKRFGAETKKNLRKFFQEGDGEMEKGNNELEVEDKRNYRGRSAAASAAASNPVTHSTRRATRSTSSDIEHSLTKKTVPELKLLCKSKGLNINREKGGYLTKKELIQSLLKKNNAGNELII